MNQPETTLPIITEEAPTSPSVGWDPHPSERCDFYHRIRVFPREVARWRQDMLAHVMAHPALFPAVPARIDKEDLVGRLDEGISFLREVSRLLAVVHGTPHLGNKTDPVDELVYIILARKTREEAYQRTFDALKARFATWDDLLRARPTTVTRLVGSGGLSAKKTQSLFGALDSIRKEFGSCTLEPARRWDDAKLEEFLCSLPEISRKSAYCIMLYAFDRQVFPVDTHVGRILARLGPYRQLGLSLEGLDHKQLQGELAELVPPNLRYSLHVNLVAHGRAICRAIRPLCEQCELRNFCAHYRTGEAHRVTQTTVPTVVDLFAGCGGMSEGFTRAGFRTLLALDNDPVALKTYRLNHPQVPDDRILCQDIENVAPDHLARLVGRRQIDVLVGSPPCQGFSHAGFRSKSTKLEYRHGRDARNFLFEYMIAAAIALRPRLVLMENVPGMQSAKQTSLSFLETAAKMLETKGDYRTAIWRLNASAFGVPQDRVRYVLVASRLGELPSMPPEEYQDIHRQTFDLDALPPVTLDEAIFDLPTRGAGNGQAVETWDPADPSSNPQYRRYLRKFSLLRSSRILYNHTVRYNNKRDLELYALLRPGEDSVHALERHRRPDLMRYRSDAFDDKYLRLRGDIPCKTIVAHLAKDGNGYIHPRQVRTLSIREGARVQSFHDGYVFCGAPSDQWIQIGNAVPPVLAEAIARTFLDLLKRRQRP